MTRISLPSYVVVEHLTVLLDCLPFVPFVVRSATCMPVLFRNFSAAVGDSLPDSVLHGSIPNQTCGAALLGIWLFEHPLLYLIHLPHSHCTADLFPVYESTAPFAAMQCLDVWSWFASAAHLPCFVSFYFVGLAADFVLCVSCLCGFLDFWLVCRRDMVVASGHVCDV